MTISEPNNSPKHWVLIRGLIRSRYHWGNFPQTLQSELNSQSVHSVELKGNGELYNERTPSMIEEAIDDLRRQLPTDTLSRFGLIGISLGGMLATKWAQLFPEEVSHLVLINSSSTLSPFYERLRPAQYPGLFRSLLTNSVRNKEHFILQATSNDAHRRAKVLDEYTEFHRQHPVQLKNFLTQLNLAKQTDFSNIPQMKKLILASTADRLVSFKCSQTIAKKWKCAVLLHASAGHDLVLDDTKWVLNAIKNSL
jgi:pimeloyl-ACP methyl ester carboxylesterase